MALATSIHNIKVLILSHHPVVAIETIEEERVVSLLRGVAAETRLPLFEWSVTKGLHRSGEVNTIHGTNEPLGVLKHLETLTIEGIFHLKDYGRYLKDPAVDRQFRELVQRFSHTQSAMVMSAPSIELPPDVAPRCVFYPLQLPDREELRQVIDSVLHSMNGAAPAGFQMTPDEFDELLQAMNGMTLNQARQAISYCLMKDGGLKPEVIGEVLDRKIEAIREDGLLEFYPAADNHFQLGGFSHMKAWLTRERMGFSPQARELNLPAPRGVLIVGVQGCGKSLAAKVIACQWKLPLLKLDAGRLFDKYIGESEKNLRRATAMAASMAPAVLWIDEIEKGFAQGALSEADGGVSRRLLGFFLTWLQEKTSQVFVVATANNLSILPPELLRKGRFDEIFYVDLPNASERIEILKIHLQLHNQDCTHFDLEHLSEAMEGFSGAEIEQAIIAALYRSLYLKRPLDTNLILQEVSETEPLSRSRREDLLRLRETAKGRFVPVN